MANDGTSILLTLLGALIGFLILYAVIRWAVIAGMRTHQEWLDERGKPETEKDPS